MKAYLINLDRSPDRLAHMSAEFERLGVEFERFPGVDARLLDDAEKADFAKARSRWEAPWLDGEIGIFLSHFGIWQMIAAGTERAAAVFEDDVLLSGDLAELLRVDDWIPQDADLVRLEANAKLRLSGKRRIPRLPARRLYEVHSGTWGAAGYVLTKDAARRLLAYPPETHCPADLFLFRPDSSEAARDLRCYQVVPAVCIQEQLISENGARFPSLVGVDGRKPERLDHRWRLKNLLPWKRKPIGFAP